MQGDVLPPGGWQFSPSSTILGLGAVLTLALAVLVWRRRARPGAVPFDGPGLYRGLAGRDPGLRRRFIVVTGGTLCAETRRFLETTGTPVLDKPFDTELVGRVVRETLRRFA